MSATLQNAGTSIFVTSLTNFGAFIIGSNTSLPALRNFSIYAAFGIIFDLIFECTLFPAVLVYDTRRVYAQGLDCAPCIKGVCGSGWCDNTAAVRAAMAGIASTLNFKTRSGFPVVKAGVVVGYVGLLVAGGWGRW